MKTNKILTLAFSLMALLAISSCVEDDDYSVPQSQGAEENAGLNRLLSKIDSGEIELQTITQVKSNFVQYEATQFVSEIAVKGYVSSSDETGNFYKEFFIQDSPTDPTQTLKVVLNQADTYNQFNKGREVYIYLKDLYIGETNTGDDVVTIGGKFDTFDNDVLEMTSNQIPNHLFRSTTTETLMPIELELSDVGEEHIGMFVKLVNVQFPASLENKPYVDPTEDYDSQRSIESCSDDSSFTLESSTFASFKNLVLPTEGKGTISGIINKTYDGYDLIINLNTTDDVVMDELRCDPLFQDSFSSATLDLWTPYNVSGAQEWYYNNFGNPSDSATMSGFSGGAVDNEDWLISLPIDLSSVPSAFLSFDTVKRYDGNDIEVYYSTDYNGGDPTTDGNWVLLPAILDTDTGSWSSWTSSGSLDVSAAAGGNLFIAFKYTSTSSAAATWEVDNIKVSAE